MCILLTTIDHPQYPLILLNNRDEYFKRPTTLAHYRPIPKSTHQILSPLDEARVEKGTWIGVNTDGQIAVLLNYREGDARNFQGKMSRGILPTDYLASGISDDEWCQNLTLRVTRDGTKIKLEEIGGFSFVYGKVRLDPSTGHIQPLHIMTNRGHPGRIFNQDESYEGPHLDIAKKTTFGISNSLYYNPWKKVELGEVLVDEMVRLAVSEKWDREELVKRCFDVLSTDTYDKSVAEKGSWLEKVTELQNSILIPPLDTLASKETPVLGKYYGTRTQTVILVDRVGNIHYYERDLYSSDDLTRPARDRHYSFKFDLEPGTSPSLESVL